MARHVTVNISIAGNSKPVTTFHSLTIQQNMGAHHQFELRVPITVFEPTGDPAIVNNSNKLMGKVITIEFADSRTKAIQNTFLGIITEITFNKFKGAKGDLLLRGFSPTIVLENGAHFASFNEKSLAEIFKKSLEKFQTNFVNSNKVNPEFKEVIPFSVQYNESTFNYFKRLASRFGEWLYYDGKDLVLGVPAGGTAVELNFGQDVSDMNLSLKIVPLNFKKSSYDYAEGKPFESPSSAAPNPDLGNFGSEILDEADSVFKFETMVVTNTTSANQKVTDTEVKTLKNQRASDMVMLSGSSDNPALALGKSLNLSVLTELPFGFKNEEFGKYIVTSVMHRTDGAGNYQNFFHAIPNTIKQPPFIQHLNPLTETETAVVKDNKDPEKLGRVKVQLRWQTGQEVTPWIRVSVPHAGKDRGFYFVPEIGDEVLVSFADNSPDNPYVTGSFYHKNAEPYSETVSPADNNYKLIRTRHGNEIFFSDESGKEQLLIANKNLKNEIRLHFANNQITIQSQGHIQISANSIDMKAKKNINIEAGEELHIKSGKLMEVKTDDEFKLEAMKKIDVYTYDEMSVMSTKNATFASNMTLTLEGTQKVVMNGIEVEVTGSASAKMSGAQANFEGTAMAVIKAPMVMIN